MQPPAANQLQAIPNEVWLRIERVLASDASHRLKDDLVRRLLAPAVDRGARDNNGTLQPLPGNKITVSKEWLTPAEVESITGRSRKAVTVAACIHKWRRQGKGRGVKYWHADALKRYPSHPVKATVTPNEAEPPLPFDCPIHVSGDAGAMAALAKPNSPLRDIVVVAAKTLAEIAKPLDAVGPSAGGIGKTDFVPAVPLVTLPPQGKRVERIHQPPIPEGADLSRIPGPVKITTFVKE